MHDFHVGQRVVCVDDEPLPDSIWRDGERPTVGAIYTICDVRLAFDNRPSVELAELKRHPATIKEWAKWNGTIPGYGVHRFRPLEEKSDAIEVFRQIARDVTAGKVRKLVGA